MTDEQKEARKKSAEEGNISWIKKHCLRTMDSDEDYVFISYKSDDYEKVLDNILFKTCQKHGLRVYFDTAFDEGSDSWITQYYENMCDPHCRAFIAFIDDKYYSSYACLLEMMSRKTMGAGGDYKEDSLFFLPINIGGITDIVDNSNTGLGTRRFSNGRINKHAQLELKKFNEIFSEIADDYMRKIYKRENDTLLYDEAYKDMPKYGKVYLTVTQCRRLMEKVIPNKNENDGGNKAFEDVIHDKLVNAGFDSVFGKVSEPVIEKAISIATYNVTVINGDFTNTIRVEKGNCVPKQDAGIKEGFEFEGWFVSGTDEEWDFSNPIQRDIEIYAKWKKDEDVSPVPKEGYQYTIFGKEYRAGSREQGKLMYDAFEALTSRHPEYAEKLTQRTSVAKAIDVKKANTKDADPTYFRGCKSFDIEGEKYLVGTSYGYNAKISEIKGMFKICGEPLSEFVLDGKPLENGRNSGSQKESDTQDVSDSFNGYEYLLWDISHNAGKLVDMINDVFDLIAEKYPNKIQDIAVSPILNAVARKDDLEQGKVDDSRARQFKNYKGKDHAVGGIIYCVNAGYNYATAKKQIENMLIVCEGNADGFRITKEKDRSTRSGCKSGKKGIGELINQ